MCLICEILKLADVEKTDDSFNKTVKCYQELEARRDSLQDTLQPFADGITKATKSEYVVIVAYSPQVLVDAVKAACSTVH
jgi:hypothetical protein